MTMRSPTAGSEMRSTARAFLRWRGTLPPGFFWTVVRWTGQAWRGRQLAAGRW